MLIKDLLNSEFVPLVPSDTVASAISKMEAWQVSGVPVIEPATKKVVGTLRFDDLSEIEDKNRPITEIIWQPPVSSYQTEHVFEAAKRMIQYRKRILAITDENDAFIGVAEKKSLFKALADMLNVASEGSVITVMMQQSDFSIAKISHLIESEGAKILGLTSENVTYGESVVNISIKLNITDTSAIISSLNRYGYIANSESHDDYYQDDLSNRASELLHYLGL